MHSFVRATGTRSLSAEKKALERNTCYEVVVSVNAPGANDPSKPVELTDMTYSVQDWNEQMILIGGEDDSSGLPDAE